MDKSKIRKEIEKLRKEIRFHDYRYYVLNDPLISDREYDSLLKRLKDLENKYPEFITPDSPTQRVSGQVLEGFPQVRHREKMLSLDNTYSQEEVKEWYERLRKNLPQEKIEFVADLKIDGVSSCITYERGILVLGATRGDGSLGEDITPNLKTIKSIPLKLIGDDHPRLIEIRGEVYMEKKDFRSLNRERMKKGESLFANPRNASAGSLKLLSPSLVSKRRLKFFVHSLGYFEPSDYFKTHYEFLERAKSWGLPVNPSIRLLKNIEEIMDYYHQLLRQRENLPYEVDGLVIKVSSLDQQRRLGSTLKSPRWAVAFKFPAHQATTIVKEVEFSVGRTGTITPVAHLKPVECGGVTISRSTLHNFEEVKRLDVRIGDWVLVERAGEVIPKIVKVIKEKRSGKEKTIRIPKKCPVCKAKVTKDKEEEVAYRCINPSCPAQLERSLIHFASRQAMDIEGMGESVVVELVKKKMVRDLADVYFLEVKDFLRLPLFALKKAESLYKAIIDSKTRPLWRFLYGLGIRHVGEKAALILARKFKTIEILRSQDVEDLQKIPEIGPIMAESIVDFFKQDQVKNLLLKFKKAGLLMREPEEKGFLPLRGKTFVFTGELESFTRTQAQDLVKKLGGDISSSVSRNTNFVVVGRNPGSKYNKAKSLGIKMLDEEGFKRTVGFK